MSQRRWKRRRERCLPTLEQLSKYKIVNVPGCSVNEKMKGNHWRKLFQEGRWYRRGLLDRLDARNSNGIHHCAQVRSIGEVNRHKLSSSFYKVSSSYFQQRMKFFPKLRLGKTNYYSFKGLQSL